MKKDKIPGFVVLAGLTTLTTVLWVAITVYFKIKKEEKTIVPEEVINSLNPSLDQETLSKITSTFYVEDSEIPESIVTASDKPSSTPIQTIKPTGLSTPSATPRTSLTPTPTSQP